MRVIDDFHGEDAAQAAREEFERIFQQHGLPDEIAEHTFASEGGRVFLPELLTAIGMASSKSEANRLLKQGAVSVDGEKVGRSTLEVTVEPGESRLLKVGKRRFARVLFE
jgi:tyrosyl-tRNA synthetase